ncbi:MAG: SwmB domain-containing protein [Balneola sp.]
MKKLVFLFMISLMMGKAENVLGQVVVNETTLISGTYTVPEDGQVTITIVGADGGDGTTTAGGQGATAIATFNVNAGDVIRYVVGESGVSSSTGSSAGGGGSTGVYINSTLVMVAGAGAGGDNSTGAIGLGGNTGTDGDAGTGTGPGAGGTGGNGGGTTTNTAAAGGGGGILTAGGSSDAGGGAAADATITNLSVLLDIASGGTGNGTGTAGGGGFTGGGGADANYSGGGGGYSGGGGAGANGSAGGGGSYIDASAISPVLTAGGDGTGTESDGSISITYFDQTAPTAPQNVAATEISNTQINITFDDVDESGSGVASYSVKRSTVQGGPYTQIGTVTDNESASYTYSDNTVSEGNTYYYVVTAIDGNSNESANSAEVSETILSVIPTPPSNVVATAIAGGNIEITFEDVNSPVGIDGYTIKRSTAEGGPYTQVGTVTDNESATYTFTDNTVSNGTTYYYVISSTDDNSVESVDSDEVSATSDNVNPVLQAASVNGEYLTLDYNEAMDLGSVPASGDFVVRVNGIPRTVTNVAINGPRIILTLDPEVLSADNVEIDYSYGTNRIQDAAGNDAPVFTNQSVTNYTYNPTSYGPSPCPIVNGQDAAWACFSGTYGGTSMTAAVGGLEIATVSAVGTNTTFAPNALQQWASGAFSGDQFNGPQVNPNGASGDATSLDINIPSFIPSDALILSLNRLRPNAGSTSYTLEAFDGTNTKVTVNDWITGQGTDGGVCSNSVILNYTNGNTTIEFQPSVSGNPSCASSSTPVWFRITDSNVERIEIRKVASQADNIHIGMAVVADFGDAPSTFGTNYSGSGNPPAFHLLNNGSPNTVYLGAGVDGDGNGASGSASNGDDTESSGIGNGDDEDGISQLTDFNTAQTSYKTTLVCTDGGNVGGWIDFDLSNTFDPNEFTSAVCASGSASLTWTGLSGLVTGTTYARFRIASSLSEVINPTGYALDGEVEDYQVTIIDPPTPDLEITKTVDTPNAVEGDQVTFTLTVTNPGAFIASGIKVTDQLPTGLTFVSSTASQGTYNSFSGIWNIGTIDDGDTTSVTLNITASIDAGTLGNTILNTASITSLNETDPELGNNSASAGVTIVPESADIGLAISVDDNTALEGQLLVFTLTATNNGPKTATGLTVIDQIPSGLTYVSSSATQGSYSNSTGIWNIGALNNGQSTTLTITVSVNAGTEGNQITNSADVNTSNQTDPVTGNNTVSQLIDVVTPGFPTSCSEVPTLSFTGFTLQSGTAGQVGAVYRFNSVTTGVYAEFEIITVNNAILVNFDQIASGGVDGWFQPQIEADNKTLSQGYIDFEISFYDSATGNPRYLTFAASAVDVDGDPNGAREFAGFQRLTSFTIETNTDLIQNTEGIFTTFESAQPVVVNGIDPQNTNNLAYTTYTNEPKFRLRAGIKDPTATGFLQRLFAFNFEPCVINNFTNPTSSDIVDISVTKSVNFVTPAVGDTVTYTIVAKNEQGNSVGNIEITDQIPAGLTLDNASVSATIGSYNTSTGVWNLGTLSGQQSATLTLKAIVNSGQEGNTITNTASLTNNTGTDGNQANNSGSANIIVFDPGSGLTCNEPPLFSFTNPSLEQGVPLQVNAIYRFSNVSSGVDALVQVIAINNATLDNIDNDGIANSPANFSPFFTANAGGGYIDYKITLVQTGTLVPVKRDFALTGLDIDGSDQGGGQTIRDYLGFSQNQSNTVEFATNLGVSTAGAFQLFESNVTTDGNGTFDTDHMAYIVYNYTSTFDLRTGSYTTGGYSDDRLVDIDFTQCRNQDFTNPVLTTRDANIAITKTADQTNPLANETVNFTLTVTNNGPENATELDVNETLPAGLTLVQATPSQGTYNQITKIWAVGSLNNGSSATLTLETTVNSGITQDSLINKAFIQGLNQNDPVVANDTAAVTIYISIPISGTVFEDKTGNGFSDDANFGDASGDQQALENVEVHLFKDGGDGVPDGNDDTYETTKLTNNLGKYTFQIGDDGDYWVVVDSKTGELTDGTTWAEQTYAPIGGLCEDGTGAFAIKTTAGHCFGGRRGAQSDNISASPVPADLANAEHVAKVTVTGAEITSIDFGFSFNVVTQVSDTDQDGSSSRTAQGSLRQFILNANAIAGANTMRFVPAVPTNASGAGGNWWSLTLGSELPAITDALTTINGTAYQLAAPTTIRDDNPGATGTGGSVGIDNISLNPVTRKEFEINLADAGANALLVNTSGAFAIRHVAIYNGDNAIRVQSSSSGIIEKNLIGVRASGVDPAGADRGGIGIEFNGAGTTSTLVQENYIGYLNDSGIKSTNSSASITVHKNEISQTALSETQADGIEGLGTWIITQNLIQQSGNSASASLNGGSGIEIGSNSGLSSGNTIRNNTIRNNVVAGITILNNVTSSLVEKNIVHGNGTKFSASAQKEGAGVKLTSPNSLAQQGIRITQNSFYGNHGISIDVVYGGSGIADGVSPNDGVLQSSSTTPNRGLDYPVFTLSTLENNVLHIEGYVGTTTTKLQNIYSIEVYKAEDDGNNNGLIEVGGTLNRPHGEGRTYIGTITTNSNGTFSVDIPISGSVSLAFNDRITAIAISSANNTSEFSANSRVVPTGVAISGFVYHDLNHNMIKDASEPGLQNVTMVLYDVQQNNCKSVLTGSDGRYEFTNVLNGSYNLIESFGQSIPTPDICTPAEVDPDNFISTTPNLRSVTVNNLPVFQDFGDYEGIKISGKVINDNGIGSGIANDGIQNGGETGFESQTVKVVTSSNTLIEQVVTAADGTYSLFVPAATVGEGGTVKVVETNGSEKISTGGSEGTTSGSYNISTDETTFNISLGTVYTGVNFADVQVSRLLTDGERTVLPGAVVTFQHLFDANTAGTVTFNTAPINNPTNPNWPVILYQDLNCSGVIDSGEPVLLPTTTVSVTAGQNVCLLLKVTAPNGLNSGASNQTTITATLSFANTSPVIQQILSRVDLTTVGTEEAGLVILKSVDKTQALPGANLVYSINYENLGDEPISQVEITDVIPSYTTYVSSSCGTLPTGITNCTITAPSVGATGTLKWSFTGTLDPGKTGVVTFTVKIDD